MSISSRLSECCMGWQVLQGSPAIKRRGRQDHREGLEADSQRVGRLRRKYAIHIKLQVHGAGHFL